jgi:hypothetical protein
MASELPPSWFKTTGSLASLRRLMGWQAPSLTFMVKSGAASLANMRPRDFIFFAAYALAGLVLPLSSFFLALLESRTSAEGTSPAAWSTPGPAVWVAPLVVTATEVSQ